MVCVRVRGAGAGAGARGPVAQGSKDLAMIRVCAGDTIFCE